MVDKPECIDRKPTEGIISIQAIHIKAIKIKNYAADKVIRIKNYAADVEITPLDNNPAHAEIVLIPEPKKMTRGMLSDLRDELARKATCIIKPNPL